MTAGEIEVLQRMAIISAIIMQWNIIWAGFSKIASPNTKDICFTAFPMQNAGDYEITLILRSMYHVTMKLCPSSKNAIIFLQNII